MAAEQLEQVLALVACHRRRDLGLGLEGQGRLDEWGATGGGQLLAGAKTEVPAGGLGGSVV
jgi:hypothetical protein